MHHNAKSIFLTFAATIALSGVAASEASAEDHYHAPLAPTVITGDPEGTPVTTFEGGTVTCSSVHARGTLATVLSSNLALTTSKTGCTAFGLANTHVSYNGCYDTYTTPSGGPTVFTAPAPHIICPESNVITTTPTVFGSSVCTITIPPQTPTSGGVTMTNVEVGGTNGSTATANVAGIHYTVDGGAGLCGATGGTKVDGKYEGSVLLTGFNDTNAASDEAHNNVREPITILNT